jgi:hypothetical protein
MRDGRADFGPPPGGITWTLDHPIAANLQLADGRWHTVVGYRVMDRAETARGSAPPPETGLIWKKSFRPAPQFLPGDSDRARLRIGRRADLRQAGNFILWAYSVGLLATPKVGVGIQHGGGMIRRICWA